MAPPVVLGNEENHVALVFLKDDEAVDLAIEDLHNAVIEKTRCIGVKRVDQQVLKKALKAQMQ